MTDTDQNDSGPRKKVFWEFWEQMAVFVFAAGMVFCAIYSLSTDKFVMTFGTFALIGFAAWLAGSVVGFIFGVPRYKATDQSKDLDGKIIWNTNLEQISDWLTKVIVGATLVQIGGIAKAIADLSTFIGDRLGGGEAVVIAGSILVLYFCTGFMWGYLWCGLRIFDAMKQRLG